MPEDNHPTIPSDDSVLLLIIAFCFSVPVILVIVWTVTDTLYPPMLVSILLGIGTAALTYRYLGGTKGSEFQVGALKVAGSAAMLLGTAFFSNWGLTSQMTRDHGPRTVSSLEAKNKELEVEIDKNATEIVELKAKLERQTGQSQEALLQSVRNTPPDSFAGRGILDLARKGIGPFSKVKRSLSVNATITEGPKSETDFHACSDLGLSGEKVRIYPANRDSDTTSEIFIEGKQTGDLRTDQCANPKASFRVRLSCKMGKALFPDSIVSCAKDGNVGWKDPRSKRNFLISIEVLSD